MSIGFAYKTTDPEVLRLIHEADDDLKAYYAAAMALQDDLPAGCQVLQWSWGRSRQITGIKAGPDQAGMPDGWRYYAKSRRWEPNRRDPRHNEIVAALPYLTEPAYPGLPPSGILDIVKHGQTFWMSPTPRLIAGVAWFGAEGAALVEGGNREVGDPWVPARYSEYVAALEGWEGVTA